MSKIKIKTKLANSRTNPMVVKLKIGLYTMVMLLRFGKRNILQRDAFLSHHHARTYIRLMVIFLSSIAHHQVSFFSINASFDKIDVVQCWILYVYGLCVCVCTCAMAMRAHGNWMKCHPFSGAKWLLCRKALEIKERKPKRNLYGLECPRKYAFIWVFQWCRVRTRAVCAFSWTPQYASVLNLLSGMSKVYCSHVKTVSLVMIWIWKMEMWISEFGH